MCRHRPKNAIRSRREPGLARLRCPLLWNQVTPLIQTCRSLLGRRLAGRVPSRPTRRLPGCVPGRHVRHFVGRILVVLLVNLLYIGCIGPEMARHGVTVKGQNAARTVTFLMLWGVNALLNTNDTQCANICFVAGWLRLREIQNYLYSLKNVLKSLNTLTSSGCIA